MPDWKVVKMQANLYKNVLNKDIFDNYQDKVMSLDLEGVTYNKDFGRYTITCFTAIRNGKLKVGKPVNVDEIESSFPKDQIPKDFDEVVKLTYQTHNFLTDFAKTTFNSETLMPTYAIVCLYKDKANLEMHKDFYCNRYVLDFCLYQKYPWDFYVEEEKFSMEENDIVSFYGEAQDHGRKDYPNPEENVVCNIMFIYAEPDDWFFNSPIEQHTGIKKIIFKNRYGLGKNIEK